MANETMNCEPIIIDYDLLFKKIQGAFLRAAFDHKSLLVGVSTTVLVLVLLIVAALSLILICWWRDMGSQRYGRNVFSMASKPYRRLNLSDDEENQI